MQTAYNLSRVYIQKAPKDILFARKALKIAQKSTFLLTKTELKTGLRNEYAQMAQKVENEARIYLEAELVRITPLLQQIDDLAKNVSNKRSAKENVADLEKIVTLTTASLKKLPEQDSLNYLQVYAVSNLSWYYVLNNDYKNAEQAAKKALDFKVSKIEWVETNLALAYLLQNNWKACVEIYDRRSNENYFTENAKWRTIFLQDLDTLKKKGIKHPNIDKAILYLNSKP